MNCQFSPARITSASRLARIHMYREWDIRNYRNYHGTGADSAVSLRVRDPPPTQGLTFKVKPERKAGWAALEGHNTDRRCRSDRPRTCPRPRPVRSRLPAGVRSTCHVPLCCVHRIHMRLAS